MQVVVRGKNVTLDDAIVEYAENKFARLDRYAWGLQRVEVELSHESTREVQGREIVQVNVIGNRLLLHGVEHAADMRVAIDTLADTMQRRLQRQKDTRETARHRAPGAKGMAAEPVPQISEVPPSREEDRE